MSVLHSIIQKIRRGTAGDGDRQSVSAYPMCLLKHADPLDDIHRHMMILLDVYNKCNLRCIMCSYPAQEDEPPISLQYADFTRIAEVFFPVSHQVNLSCAYEPLMFKGFLDYLSTALQHNVPKLTITTNATLLNRAMAEDIVRLGLPQINISVDGATRETYETIRVRASFDTLLTNLRNLAAIKKESGQLNPRIQFQLVMFAHTLHEAPEAVKLLSAFEPFKFVFIHHDYSPPTADRRPQIDATLRAALAECVAHGIILEEVPNYCLSFEEIIEAYGGRAEEAPNLAPGCLDPWSFMQITPDGNVFVCPTIRQPAGNIHQTDILEIWNGDAYRWLRDQWNRNTPPSICQACSYSNTGLVQLRRARDRMDQSIEGYTSSAKRQL